MICGWDKKAERLRLEKVARLSEKDFIRYRSLDRNISRSHSDCPKLFLRKNGDSRPYASRKLRIHRAKAALYIRFFNIQPLTWRIWPYHSYRWKSRSIVKIHQLYLMNSAFEPRNSAISKAYYMRNGKAYSAVAGIIGMFLRDERNQWWDWDSFHSI